MVSLLLAREVEERGLIHSTGGTSDVMPTAKQKLDSV
jgi:hypothetical protein